jgi:hypothetical protein
VALTRLQRFLATSCAVALGITLLVPGPTPGRVAAEPAAAAGRTVRPRAAVRTHERILANEDSLRVYVAPETTHVVARRVPLAEIIRKAQDGERHRYDSLTTLAFNRTIKITLKYGGRKPQTRCIESIARVYFQSPDRWAETTIREEKYVLAPDGSHKPWKEKNSDGEDNDDVTISVGDDNGSQSARRLSDLPPYLEETDKYDFEILNRSIRPGQVLYEIGFEPRSDFDMLPGGRLWLLTNGYQIVREEYHLKNLPVPWLLKSLALVTREWQEVDGTWVPSRITARAGLRSGVGLGLIDIPETVEVVLSFDQYRFEVPLDPKLFEGRPE